jgi:hypothetical protein
MYAERPRFGALGSVARSARSQYCCKEFWEDKPFFFFSVRALVALLVFSLGMMKGDDGSDGSIDCQLIEQQRWRSSIESGQI